MPALDKYHSVVKDALVREGWIITHDPYSITIGSRPAQIDLGAEMPLAAEKEGRRIAVEIKSFLGPSELYDLYQALGQFGVYNAVLAERDPERALYLAAPQEMHDYLLNQHDFRNVLRKFSARLIFFSVEGKEPLQWIETADIGKL